MKAKETRFLQRIRQRWQWLLKALSPNVLALLVGAIVIGVAIYAVRSKSSTTQRQDNIGSMQGATMPGNSNTQNNNGSAMVGTSNGMNFISITSSTVNLYGGQQGVVERLKSCLNQINTNILIGLRNGTNRFGGQLSAVSLGQLQSFAADSETKGFIKIIGVSDTVIFSPNGSTTRKAMFELNPALLSAR